MPLGKTMIHATLDPMDLNKDVPAQYGLIGDARLTLEALRAAMAKLDRRTAEAGLVNPSALPPFARPGCPSGWKSLIAARHRSTRTGCCGS